MQSGPKLDWAATGSRMPIAASELNTISTRVRDLDNFLIEELRSSGDFRQWFLGQLRHCLDIPPYAQVAVGKIPKRESAPGQTDLSFGLKDGAGTPQWKGGS